LSSTHRSPPSPRRSPRTETHRLPARIVSPVLNGGG
jgi:hypothetical protein